MSYRTLSLRTAAVALLMCSSSTVFGVVIADSVTDFSNVQGQANWTYNKSDGVTLTPLANFINDGSSPFGNNLPNWSDAPDDNPPHTKLWAAGGHPGATGDLAVRTWTVPNSGFYTVSGTYQKLDNGGGDGSIVAVARNSTVVGSNLVANNAPAGNYSYTIAAKAGDTINFAISRGVGGNNFNDSTTFTAQIATDPNIISLNLAGGNEFGNGGPYNLASNATAGVVPANNWNNLGGNSGTQPNLLSQGGGNSGASATWNSNGNYSASGISNTGGNDTMLKGHLDGRASGFGPPEDPTLTVSSLPANIANGLYDVYVYFSAETNQVFSNYTIGSQTFYVNPANTFSGAFVLGTSTTPGVYTVGANYLKFSNLTGSSFTLTADSESFRAELSGLQIVPVPEPSSVVMALFGGTLMFGLFPRRRHSR